MVGLVVVLLCVYRFGVFFRLSVVGLMWFWFGWLVVCVFWGSDLSVAWFAL